MLKVGSIFTSDFAYGQNYGLQFQGQNFTLDKRTELNLTPEEFLKLQGEIELSFDYRATQQGLSYEESYFGYIFRIISESGQNIDLLSSPKPNLGLNLVIGNSHFVIPIPFKNDELKQWINLRFKISLKEDRLEFFKDDTSFIQEEIGLNARDAFKIIFGANDYKQFKNSDVPSMVIKDVKIIENQKLKYFWPLDEESGGAAIDRIKSKKAFVKNPNWLVLSHQNWAEVFSKKFKGRTTLVGDIDNGRIFILGLDKYYIYSFYSESLHEKNYINKPFFLSNIYRAVFNPSDSCIYCYHLGKKLLYKLDVASGEWNQQGEDSFYESEYRHHNSYLRPKDNSVYTFGGYGFHQYKNDIWKIDLQDGTFNKLLTVDSILEPRYLGGIGELNDTVYLLGGYGSKTGNQLINPHSYFNLSGFSFSDSSMFHLFSIPRIHDDMVLANQMWIDSTTRQYYALIYEKSKFDGNLQLIRGNLSSPGYEFVGNKISYQFLDTKSFASLFFDPHQKNLIALKSYYTDNDSTHIQFSSINYPPNVSQIVSGIKVNKGKLIVLISLLIIAIVFLIFIFYQFVKRKNRRKPGAEDITPDQIISFETQLKHDSVDNYKLILFGGFQVFDSENVDVTIKFSPLLKELLLLILLYTFKNDKGISSTKIQEILWPDKSEKSARNNRTVNIAKLRTLLNNLGQYDISKKTGYWKIHFSQSDHFCDYISFMEIVSSKTNLTRQKLMDLINITEKGGFLQNVQYEWLDEFKAQVSDLVVDTLIKYGEACNLKKESDMIIHLADIVFAFDFSNEDAMILKCKAQQQKGQHSLARETYQKFCKEYSHIYDIEYSKPYAEIITGKNTS